MIDYANVLLNLVKPMCQDKDNVTVKQMDSLDENEILLYVYAPSDDIGRLIGRQGNMASAIREMLKVASKSQDKKITVKFESL
ncbi:MAG: KH domain-containing protein [Erysipelotrichaceae bacterium]|jgi:predicted RNA-binding protein YlqC (UPF0109 family)|nr:KH domain-containing protein [Erysipelotrichaceae bacterium]MBR2809484.1 KH domain-containing protein [Erysipelotrichaceae bacterium]